MLKKTNDLNALTLRPSVGGLKTYSLCRYSDRQQPMLKTGISCEHAKLTTELSMRPSPQVSTTIDKDLNHETENRSRDYLSSVSLWKMGASLHPFP